MASPLLLFIHAASGDTPAHLAYPKILTFRLEAHRVSIYGGISVAKITTLTAASKDPVGESHATELMSKPVHPKYRNDVKILL